MFCLKCKTEIFGGSVCHVCGGLLAVSEASHEAPVAAGGVKIRTRMKFRVSKEFGQTLAGRIGRLILETALFCAGFYFLTFLIVAVANWLSKEMALDQQKIKFIDVHSSWMKYLRYIGCGIIAFLTVKLRFKPGK
jgi:hypothetical protein